MPTAETYATSELSQTPLALAYKLRLDTGGSGDSSMITIGIRAGPGAVTFAVIDTKDNSVINVEKIKIPAAFERPDALKYVRSNLLDILREYHVEQAGIRVTESVADASTERIQLEGVIQEAFASSELKAYYVGQISSISARLGIDENGSSPWWPAKRILVWRTGQ